jgi:hypothetical protein
VADTYGLGENTVLTVNSPGVLVNDYDADGDSLTAVLVTGVSSGTLSLAMDGSFTYTPNAHFFGTDSFTYSASDGQAASDPATVQITVNQVNSPPDVTPASPSLGCLWPPNHTYTDVTVGGIIDPDGDLVSLKVTGVMSDEQPGLVKGAGGDRHDPDARITGDTATLLRAERSGTGNGRVYTILFTATDIFGAESTGSVTVCVPHDMNHACLCTKDVQQYDATKPN